MGNNILSARFRDTIPGARLGNDFVNRNGTFGARPSSRFNSRIYSLPQVVLDVEGGGIRLPNMHMFAKYISYDLEVYDHLFPITKPKRMYQTTIHNPDAHLSLNWPMPRLKHLVVAMRGTYPVKE